MRDGRPNGADPAEQGRRDSQDVDNADAYKEVLLDRSIGTPSQLTGENDLAEVIRHKCDVRRFECRLRATRSHGNAYIGASQGRRIVDSIADHGDPIPLDLQPANAVNFVLRQQFRFDFIDTQFGGVVPAHGDHTGGVSATIEYAVRVLEVPDTGITNLSGETSRVAPIRVSGPTVKRGGLAEDDHFV